MMDRHEQFLQLVLNAQACNVCPRMTERTAVLSLNNGSLHPRVLFVAEAPGRKGGDRTRIPMSGDSSGRTFQRLLASAGLTPGEVFITNAVLCNPRGETGATRPPLSAEVRNCNAFLRRTVSLLDPPLVVSIGGAALAALERIEPHGLALGKDVGSPVEWFGRKLIPLYHPSPQVLISRRSLDQQEVDWQTIRKALDNDR
jgi:uracil-DNA glycosylase family 4